MKKTGSGLNLNRKTEAEIMKIWHSLAVSEREDERHDGTW